MAREVVAAFRAIITFLVLSWGALMYLVFYRIPKLDTENIGEKQDDFYGSYSQELKASIHRQLSFDRRHDLNSNNAKIYSHLERLKEVNFSSQSGLFEKKLRGTQAMKNAGNVLNWLSRGGMPEICSKLQNMTNSEVLGHGYTKIVKKVELNGRQVAVKSIHLQGKDVKTCMVGRKSTEINRCANLAKYKLLREALLLSQLKTPYVVQILGACIWSATGAENESSDHDSTVVVTELGKPLSLLDIIRLPWDERFKMSMDLLLLLYYLTSTPYGSLIITDFKLDQFVIADGIVKLSDVDDLDNHPKTCTTYQDCFLGGSRWNTTLPCINQKCLHYNERANLYNLYRLILDYTLDFEHPRGLSEELSTIGENIRKFQVRVYEVLKSLTEVVIRMRRGEYALTWKTINHPGNHKDTFKCLNAAYVPNGLFDFYCQRSRSMISCELSAHNLEEAEILCTHEKLCKAVVITPDANWLGQRIVILKSSSKVLMSREKYSVLVKG